MFRSMPGCGDYMDLKCTQINNTFLGQGLVFKSDLCFGARANHGTGLMGKLAIAGDKVSVQVGIKYMRQRKSPLIGGLQVLIHVAQRIDQDPLFGVVGSNQVGRIAESFIHKWFDKPGLFHVKIIIALTCIKRGPV